MNLRAYIQSFTSKKARGSEIRRLANSCEVSTSYIRGFIAGLHKITPELALKLFHASNGLIAPHETCPSIYPVEYKGLKPSAKQ